MANPKLLVPGPQRRPYVGGLLAVANVVDITDPHAAMGVQYDFNQCAMPLPAPGLCWSSVDPGGTKDNVIAPGVQDAPITGAIYAAAQCYAYDTRQGEADYEAQARDLLMGGESFAMERVFFDQYLDGATSFPAIDASLVGAIGTAEQERVIGREKLSDIELPDGVKPAFAHNALTSIEDEDGNELKIVRDNMPFGEIGKGEFGTYFIGYARSPQRIERMLENMFIGNPPGNYDRLLDFSRATTGTLFFVPSLTFIGAAGPGGKAAASSPSESSDG